VANDELLREKGMLIEKDSYEFAQVLERSRQRGEVTEFSTGNERRNYPRLKIISDDLWIDTMAHFEVVNMSPSGVALNCNHPVRLGEVLRFALGPLQGADAKVIGCELIDSPTEYLDAQYRVHCKFLNTKAGMKLVVKAQQLDQRLPKKPTPSGGDEG
jgi:hypothetical protein